MRNSNLQARFFARIFWIALLAGLSSGMASVRLAAQEAAPAAVAQPAATAAETARPEAAKSDEEDNNTYRHTALVAASAKALHLDVETMARIYEIINFAIIVLAIVIPLAKLMPRVMRKRSQTLLHSLETAKKATGDANTRLSVIEAKMAGLDQEIAAIRAQVEKESLDDQARIQASLREESERIVASAEQEISVAAAQARRGLRHFAADLAIDQAARQLVLTPETDRALIAEFSAELAKGGQN